MINDKWKDFKESALENADINLHLSKQVFYAGALACLTEIKNKTSIDDLISELETYCMNEYFKN